MMGLSLFTYEDESTSDMVIASSRDEADRLVGDVGYHEPTVTEYPLTGTSQVLLSRYYNRGGAL